MLYLVKLNPEYLSYLLVEAKGTCTLFLFLLAAKKKLLSYRFVRTPKFWLPIVLRAQPPYARNGRPNQSVYSTPGPPPSLLLAGQHFSYPWFFKHPDNQNQVVPLPSVHTVISSHYFSNYLIFVPWRLEKWGYHIQTCNFSKLALKFNQRLVVLSTLRFQVPENNPFHHWIFICCSSHVPNMPDQEFTRHPVYSSNHRCSRNLCGNSVYHGHFLWTLHQWHCCWLPSSNGFPSWFLILVQLYDTFNTRGRDHWSPSSLGRG